MSSRPEGAGGLQSDADRPAASAVAGHPAPVLAHRCRDGADAASAAASDGTVSDELRQHVAKGARSTAVTLLWSFDGPGSLTATATLDVLGPQQRSAATTFSYRCAG